MPFPDHFDLIAPFYDRALPQREDELLITLIGLPLDGVLLDAGGGTGRIGAALRPLVSQVVVADLSLGMLGKAREKPGLQAVCSQSERLPFPDGWFDRIIMVDALHHVHNQSHTAVELLRVLKPGGRLVIEEPDIRRFAVKLIAIAERLLFMRSHFLFAERIAALFAHDVAGFRIIYRDSNAWIVIDKNKAG
jgi:ubiquinone/menaquinone biosynthesis C-methylase UbiE